MNLPNPYRNWQTAIQGLGTDIANVINYSALKDQQEKENNVIANILKSVYSDQSPAVGVGNPVPSLPITNALIAGSKLTPKGMQRLSSLINLNKTFENEREKKKYSEALQEAQNGKDPNYIIKRYGKQGINALNNYNKFVEQQKIFNAKKYINGIDFNSIKSAKDYNKIADEAQKNFGETGLKLFNEAYRYRMPEIKKTETITDGKKRRIIAIDPFGNVKEIKSYTVEKEDTPDYDLALPKLDSTEDALLKNYVGLNAKLNNPLYTTDSKSVKDLFDSYKTTAWHLLPIELRDVFRDKLAAELGIDNTEDVLGKWNNLEPKKRKEVISKLRKGLVKLYINLKFADIADFKNMSPGELGLKGMSKNDLREKLNAQLYKLLQRYLDYEQKEADYLSSPEHSAGGLGDRGGNPLFK